MGKYLKYAIGEIILVVTGILIALQINNWNEERKNKFFETKILSEIRKDLILDTIYIRALKKRSTLVTDAADRLKKMGASKNIDPDSLAKYFYNSGIGINFNYHNGAYESLKSVGLDRVSNDSLRNAISEMYDFRFRRYQELITNVQKNRDRNYVQTFEAFFFYDLSANANGAIPSAKIPVDKLYEEPKFTTTIVHSEAYANEIGQRLNASLYHITKLLEHLDHELQIKEPHNNLPKVKWQ